MISFTYQDAQAQYAIFTIATVLMIIILPNELQQVIMYWRVAPTDRILKQRFPYISLVSTWLLIVDTFAALLFIVYQSNIGQISEKYSTTWYLLMALMGVLLSFIESTGYALAFRFWIVYYQTQVSSIAQSHQWRVLINRNYKIKDMGKKHGQWFINHKKDFGNYYFCKRLCFICSVTGQILGIILFALQLSKNINWLRSLGLIFRLSVSKFVPQHDCSCSIR